MAGNSAPPCMMSRTFNRRRPSLPPGWNAHGNRHRAKIRVFPIAGRRRWRRPAPASPWSTWLGRGPWGTPRQLAGMTNDRRHAAASANELSSAAGNGNEREFRSVCSTRPRSASSVVSPEFDKAKTASPGVIMPKVAMGCLGGMHKESLACRSMPRSRRFSARRAHFCPFQ